MSIINLSVKRPVGTIMFFVGVILLGYVSLSRLSINLLPDLSYPKITVVTEYPGSGPEEIEKFITTKLEGPLSAIPNVKKISSFSKEAASIITIEFHWGTDMDFALLHTKEKTEEARRELPEDCAPPMILEWDPTSTPIVTAILRSQKKTLKELKESAEFIIKPRLEQLEGISRVEIRGGDEEEISVEVNPDKARNLGITLEEVAAAIENNNIFQSGGTIRKGRSRFTLKIEGEIQEPTEIEVIPVKSLEGRNVLLGDIGTAFYKNKLREGDIRFNGRGTIALLMYRDSGGNTVDATRKVEASLDELSREFADLEFFVISQEARLIISSINSLQFSLLLGAFLAFLILLLFLQNFRDPFLVATVIPISVISTFVLMFLFKVNVNIMSLGGLVLGVGMFLDNSIIVLEAIFRHRKDESLMQSVISGAREVSGAITASTFTTISIFLPVIYLYGITGKLFRDQAMTVSFSLVSSLIVAITLLPALSAFKALGKSELKVDFDPSRRRRWFHTPLKGIYAVLLIPFQLLGNIIYFVVAFVVLILRAVARLLAKILHFLLQPLFRAFNAAYTRFDAIYHRVLEAVLDRKSRAAWLVVVVLALIAGTYLLLDKELLPAPDSRKFEITADTRPEYGFEETDRVAGRVEARLQAMQGVEFVYTEVGLVSKLATRSEDFSVNRLHFIVSCAPEASRPRLMDRGRNILKSEDLDQFTVFLEKNTLSQYLAVGGERFQIKVFYEEIERGREAVARIMEKIAPIPGLVDLKAGTARGKPMLTIAFRQELLDQLGITRRDVSAFIRQAVRGQKAGSLKKIQKSYDIFVRVPVDGTMELNRMLSLPVSHQGRTYYLRDLVTIEETPSIKEISREAQERYFMISADVRDRDLESVIADAEKALLEVEFPMNTRYAFSGEEEERRKAFDSLQQAILLAIILVYMIMAAKFENLAQPLIIMFTVPMGLVGAFLFLLLTGNSINIISGIGILVLVGIGVNDAIVKVEYSNQLRDAGMSVREAVMEASRVRLRPILMTTFTTIFGLIPMAAISTSGSELQRPLALVVIGGLLCTTFLTLILIPVSYEVLESLKQRRRARNGDSHA
ncbi:MAG TPA: efflux RND transporter permease subunit [Candidatus Aminicenantes bacterium]|nr:efflux RND transporter permease subunit [Candidatus Aminicenantes bacterium]